MSIHPSFPCINPFVQHGGYLTYPTQKLLNFVVSIILSHRQYLDQVLSQKQRGRLRHWEGINIIFHPTKPKVDLVPFQQRFCSPSSPQAGKVALLIKEDVLIHVSPYNIVKYCENLLKLSQIPEKCLTVTSFMVIKYYQHQGYQQCEIFLFCFFFSFCILCISLFFFFFNFVN